ncbi:hypothetical protein HA402_000753 [Bradysia odoriphaga]|nr:hypothetical protein HA402_000753 [Bradysia odoriphaga]
MIFKRYLNESQLKGFERYKYSSIDNSIFSTKVMHPFWNWCVQFFPRWIAPNLITFTGFLLTIANFLLIGYYDYGFTAVNDKEHPIPRWVWLVASINIFLAYTLDGIDGKQARRTGTSGPLGELFDHGVDSYSAVLIPIYVFSLFGKAELSPLRMHFVTWNVFLNFYLTHFEKYNTGVLFLPWAYDFTMWGVTLTLLVTFLFGTNIWHTPLPGGIAPAFAFEWLLYISGIISSHPFIIYNVYKSYKNKTGKMRPILEALRPLMPFTALFVITTIWVMLSRNDICFMEPRLLFLLFGTIFSNICCRLIVAQMSDTRTEGWNAFFWPLLVAVSISIFPYRYFAMGDISPATERWLVYVLTSMLTIAHFHYGQGVVREMCRHFKIKCFKVREPITNNNQDKIN